MKNLKDDIDFLEEVLEKIISSNLHDKMEGEQMLRDQISHMQKRHLTQQSSGQETPNPLKVKYKTADLPRREQKVSCR